MPSPAAVVTGLEIPPRWRYYPNCLVRRRSDACCDVAVIGGGPAGSAAASLLARRRPFASWCSSANAFRASISANRSCRGSTKSWRRSAPRTAVASEGFVQKWGASFTTANGEADQYADFSQAFDVPRPQTIQVPSARFDQVLLEHAARSGAHVLEGHTTKDAAVRRGRRPVTHAGADGSLQSIRVAAVIDASGRAGFLAKRFGERRKDPLLQNISVHRQYRGNSSQRGSTRGRYSHGDQARSRLVLVHTHFSDTVISVGVVVPQAVYNAHARRRRRRRSSTFSPRRPRQRGWWRTPRQ